MNVSKSYLSRNIRDAIHTLQHIAEVYDYKTTILQKKGSITITIAPVGARNSKTPRYIVKRFGMRSDSRWYVAAGLNLITGPFFYKNEAEKMCRKINKDPSIVLSL
jgi:hypothetical protein